MEQKDNIFTLEAMTENRKEILKIYTELKGKFLTGKFTLNNLLKYYNYSNQSAALLIDALVRNGMLNGKLNSDNSMVYEFENDKQNQINNILLWLERAKNETMFFEMTINVIENEINTKK